MSKKHFEAQKKVYHIGDVEVEFRPWTEEYYFLQRKGGVPDDPLLQTDNVDIVVRWKDEQDVESFYVKSFEKLSDSKYTQFIEKFLVDPKYRDTYLVGGENWPGVLKLQGEEKPAVHPKCASSIKKIENTREQKLRFQDFAQLKTYGLDSFSRKKIPELEALVGADAIAEIKMDSRMEDDKLYSTALKWCARGLSPQHAVRKVMTDKEISENSRGHFLR